jgi:hypothetical protein
VYKRQDIYIPRHSYGKLREGDCIQADGYEEIDGWLHTFNASHWMQIEDKDDLVEDLLQKYGD